MVDQGQSWLGVETVQHLIHVAFERSLISLVYFQGLSGPLTKNKFDELNEVHREF